MKGPLNSASINDLTKNATSVARAEADLYQSHFIPNAGYSDDFEEEESQFPPESEWTHEKADSGNAKNESMKYHEVSCLSDCSDGLYFREVGRLPLLSREEEGDLAKRIFEGEKRIEALLLQSPVGLEWIAQTVSQMEKDKIRPKDVMEIFGGRNEESQSELRKRFISCAKEILKLCVQNHRLQEKFEGPGGEDYSRTGTIPRNRIAIAPLIDSIRLKTDILMQLESDLRKRANLVACHGKISWFDGSLRRLEGDLSLVQKVRHEVKEAKDKLVKGNLRLVIKIARKYVNPGLSLIDLIQEGNIGLVRAVDRFDYRKGHKFGTYASWWIMQRITRAMADQGRPIRIPVHVIEEKMKIRKISCNLFDRLGRVPTLLEMAETANIPLDKVKKIVHTPTELPISLETPIGERGRRLSDFTTDENGVSPHEMVIHTDLRRQIRKVLASLSPREARILRKRFGIDEKRKYTMEELGREFGVSKERIRQIQYKAMTKLKQRKGKHELRSFCE